MLNHGDIYRMDASYIEYILHRGTFLSIHSVVQSRSSSAHERRVPGIKPNHINKRASMVHYCQSKVFKKKIFPKKFYGKEKETQYTGQVFDLCIYGFLWSKD